MIGAFLLYERGGKESVNVREKGTRAERELCTILNDRFDTDAFSRVVGSGNRWAQVGDVPRDYIGDIVCPDWFRFSIECKSGYRACLTRLLATGREVTIEAFLAQVSDDAERARRDPLLCWKPDRLPWLAAVRERLPFDALRSGKWTILRLSDLLTMDREWWGAPTTVGYRDRREPLSAKSRYSA